MSDSRSRPGDFAATRPLSWSERLRGALLGGAVGDVLGSGVRGWSLPAIHQWLGGRGAVDFLPVFGRRGAVSDLSQLTVFTVDALLRARATGEQDPLPVVRSNHLAWLYTQGVPWAYAMAGYWRSHPEPAGWLLKRPELFSTRNPGGNALRLLSALVDRFPADPTSGPLRDAPAGEEAFADCLVWTAPLMVWSPDARRVAATASRVPRLLTGHYETRAASALHADVLGGLLNGTPLWEAVRSWELHRSHQEQGVPPAAVLRTVHSAMFIAQQGRQPDPRMLDIEFCPSEGLGELGIAVAAVASAGNFTDAVVTAVNHSADSAVAGALAGQLAGAIHGPEAIPPRWRAELDIREVLETLASDAAEAFAPPEPPKWARRYVQGEDPRELGGGGWTVETTRGEPPGPVEQAPPTQVLPPVVDEIPETAPGGQRSTAERPGTPEETPEGAAPPPAGEHPGGDTPPAREEAPDTDPHGLPHAAGRSAPWERDHAESSVPATSEGSATDPGDPGDTAGADPERPEPHPDGSGQGTDRILLRAPEWTEGDDRQEPPSGTVRDPEEPVSAPEPPVAEEPLPADPETAEAGERRTPRSSAHEEPDTEEVPESPDREVEPAPEEGFPELGATPGETPEEAGTPTPEAERPRQDTTFGVVSAPENPRDEGTQQRGARIRLPGMDQLPPLPRNPWEGTPPRGAADGEHSRREEGGDSEENPSWEELVSRLSTGRSVEVPYMESMVMRGDESTAGRTGEPESTGEPSTASSGGEHAVVEEPDAAVPSTTERILGCLLGSATGDAFGAGPTPMSAEELTARYGAHGPGGMTEYAGSRGAVTAATQTMLFTCEGLIRAGEAQAGGDADPFREVRLASQRWLHTQGVSWPWAVGDLVTRFPEPDGWLVGVSELFAVRSPGGSVYAELEAFGDRSAQGDQTAPVDNSTGCGGLVRALPAAFWSAEPAEVFDLGVRIASLTHGHPSGYLPAGAFAVIVQQAVLGRGLDDGVWLALQVLETWQGHEDTSAALSEAAELAAAGRPEPHQLESRLGGGTRADQVLGIAVCAALTAEDVRGALRTAVHHSGNSSAAAAVCGGIVGAQLGVGALPVDWMAELELRDTVERMAMDCVAAFDARLRAETPAAAVEEDGDWRRRYPVRTEPAAPEAVGTSSVVDTGPESELDLPDCEPEAEHGAAQERDGSEERWNPEPDERDPRQERWSAPLPEEAEEGAPHHTAPREATEAEPNPLVGSGQGPVDGTREEGTATPVAGGDGAGAEDGRETSVIPVVPESAGDAPAPVEAAEPGPESPGAEEDGVSASGAERSRATPEPVAPVGSGDGASAEAGSATLGEGRPPKPAPRRINSVSTGELDLTGESVEN